MSMSNRKISDLIKELQDALEKHGNLDLVSSSYDEGNSYDLIYYDTTLGFFEVDDENIFIPEESFNCYEDEYEEGDLKINAICIN